MVEGTVIWNLDVRSFGRVRMLKEVNFSLSTDKVNIMPKTTIYFVNVYYVYWWLGKTVVMTALKLH